MRVEVGEHVGRAVAGAGAGREGLEEELAVGERLDGVRGGDGGGCRGRGRGAGARRLGIRERDEDVACDFVLGSGLVISGWLVGWLVGWFLGRFLL